MALACPDHATLDLILQLQLDDIAALDDAGKGKARNNESENLARALYAEEVGRLLGDRRMARSMAMAVQADAMVVREHQVLERSEERDRLVACRLEGEEGDPVAEAEAERDANTGTNKQQLNEEFILDLAASYIGNLEGDKPEHVDPVVDKALKAKRPSVFQVASGGTASKKANTVEDLTVECRICMDDAPVSMVVDLAACGHLCCRECIRVQFQKAIMNEELYPPRCCEPIPLNVARHLLSDELALAFEKVELEYKTPNRMYCATKLCSRFIPPAKIDNDIACCDECGMISCTICKSDYHDGECPKDENTQTLLEVAVSKGWKRCAFCERVVELAHGCFHITCLCGHHFCYTCGKKWKTCTCATWDTNRLLRN